MKKKDVARPMAKRLTKALREKRRWFGLAVSPSCTQRGDVEDLIERLAASIEPKPNLRLMDYFSAAERAASAAPTPLTASVEGGLAVLRVHLKDAPSIRSQLQREEALEKHGLESLTMSGNCLLYTSPSPRDVVPSRMPSSA